MNLLTRFYDPTRGQILLDGVDLRDYRLADLRNQFAIVLQEPVLFSTSIAENIAYARPGASEQEIIEAAEGANAHDFISRLPQGYDTVVGERGMRLSGGERQRISIARAFLKQAPILILDEPTSSVDLKTEAAILEALDRLVRGRTTFVITHRTTALKQCDFIVRIEHGPARRDRPRMRCRCPRDRTHVMATVLSRHSTSRTTPTAAATSGCTCSTHWGSAASGATWYWLEQFRCRKEPDWDAIALAMFFDRMRRFGFEGRVLLYTIGEGPDSPIVFFGATQANAEAILRRADLLLNFHYGIDERLLAGARRSALVDIDPGLTQLWISTGLIRVPRHDVYFTIGETVGTPEARFPDCGLPWVHIRPPVYLPLWPFVNRARCEAFTTVAGWWSGRWVKLIEDGKEVLHENNKRITFLEVPPAARDDLTGAGACAASCERRRGGAAPLRASRLAHP